MSDSTTEDDADTFEYDSLIARCLENDLDARSDIDDDRKNDLENAFRRSRFSSCFSDIFENSIDSILILLTQSKLVRVRYEKRDAAADAVETRR